MTFKFSFTGILLTTVVLTPHSLAAGSHKMEDLVVTTNRYPQALSNIGSSLSLITAEELEKSQTILLQDHLQSTPGLSLNQNGAFGGVSSVRIRGAAAAQTVVLIDGIQLNDAASPNGAFDFAHLDTTGIARVEVLRGPQSILYGSDAMGGVINIITSEGHEGLSGNAYGEGGSYNSFRAGGNVAGGNDNVTFNLGIGAQTTDGISKADKKDGNSEDDGYRAVTLHGKITGKISDRHRLQFISRYGNNRTEYDGFPPPLYSLADTNDVAFSEDFLIAGRGFFNYFDNRFQNTLSVEYSTLDRRGEADGVPVDYLTFESRRLNFDYFGHYKIDDHITLSAGLQHEEIKAASVSALTFNIDSIFSELSWQGLGGLTLTAGLRYDDHNRYGGTTTPRLTASYYHADSDTKVFANWGEGFKAPTIYQLTDVWSGNPDLKPEETNGWEVGFYQGLAAGMVHFGATYFDQKFKNLIDWQGTYHNIAAVHSRGVEVMADVKPLPSLTLSGNYTYSNARNRTTDLPLIRVPKHAAFGQIEWQALDALYLAFSLTYNGAETDSFTPGPDGWVRADVRASYALHEHLSVYGRVDNLFDKEYQQVKGYGTPGQSFFVGLKGHF